MRSTVRNTRAAVVLATVLIALNVGDTRGSAAPKDRVVAGPPSQAFGNLPLNFVANRGQSDARVQYVAQGLGYAFYLTRREIVLAFVNGAPAPPAVRGHTVAMRFVGGDPDVAIDGGRKEGVVSYLRGSDASRWRAELPAYTDVVYRSLWPGVDLHIAGRGGVLKYEFHVASGADPSAIRLAYDGASSLTIARQADC